MIITARMLMTLSLRLLSITALMLLPLFAAAPVYYGAYAAAPVVAIPAYYGDYAVGPVYYGGYANRSYITRRPTLFPRYYGW